MLERVCFTSSLKRILLQTQARDLYYAAVHQLKRLHQSTILITRMEVTSLAALLNSSPGLNSELIQSGFRVCPPLSCVTVSTQARAHIHTVWAATAPDLKTESVMTGNPSVDFDF